MPRPDPETIRKAERDVTSIACAEDRHADCSGQVLKARGFWRCQCACHKSEEKVAA